MPHRRRRQHQGLERVLGTPALFSTAYGNVGSSIYYALGLTPVVFVIAGLIFACTAATYAEGTVLYPEAGGSSSFARHAFNETVSFGAAWAQMLNYMATIAVSAFFVPHYLSIFWEPLKSNPWDIVGGALVILILVSINIVGIKEAARLNVGLAVIDFATQLLLVLLGFVLVFSPHVLVSNVSLGVAPTWSQFALAIPVAMLAYTGIETVSNMAEEARDPRRTIPRAVTFVAIAVFAIYFTLPMIALSAMPVELVDGKYQTILGLGPEQGGFANDPVLGLVDNLGLHGFLLDSVEIYVGVLAATILFIGANAGVIGASRITYAMSGYRQLPQLFHKVHPRFRTPWLALVVFGAAIPIGMTLPGETNFLGTIYSFGATLSFTVAHAAVVRLRVKRKEADAGYEARPNVRFRGINWPLFALIGGLGTGLSWLVIVIQSPSTRYAGLGWLAIGFAFYYVYRRRVLHQPLGKTIRAPVEVIGPSLTVEYRTVVVPVERTGESEEALVAAARLAADRGATVAVVHVLEIPLALPIDASFEDEADEAEQLLDDAQALVESYGVRAVTRLLRARKAGPAIVEEARRRDAELVVLGAPLRAISGRRRLFGGTVDYVLREAPCRVLVAAGKRAVA